MYSIWFKVLEEPKIANKNSSEEESAASSQPGRGCETEASYLVSSPLLGEVSPQVGTERKATLHDWIFLGRSHDYCPSQGQVKLIPKTPAETPAVSVLMSEPWERGGNEAILCYLPQVGGTGYCDFLGHFLRVTSLLDYVRGTFLLHKLTQIQALKQHEAIKVPAVPWLQPVLSGYPKPHLPCRS